MKTTATTCRKVRDTGIGWRRWSLTWIHTEAPEDDEEDKRTDTDAVVNDRSVSTDTRVSASWTDMNASTLVSRASADKTAKVTWRLRQLGSSISSR